MKVFLGGTCNNSLWRNEIIPMLRVDYFNPVVDDWTEECRKQEIKEREKCEVCLYVITPKMIGVHAIAEVIDDSNEKPDKTILVILEEDDGIRFKEEYWKSLIAVAKMVENNGSKIFGSLRLAAYYINVTNLYRCYIDKLLYGDII